MKLLWSPDTATKAYIDTVRSCQVFNESGVAELVSAMAAGWNAKLIVETWSQGGAIATSIGLEVASRHTCRRHVCVVSDENARSEFITAMKEAADMNPEVLVGEPEEVMSELVGIDFMVVDCKRKDYARVLRQARLNQRGAVLVCKNANSKSDSGFRWRSVIDCGSRRVVRTVFLPVGKGIDMAHVSSCGGNSGSGSSKVEKKRWIKHYDQQSGEEHVIRK
ncbi:hypothetical protein ACLB2K_051197 [Fragaria x ananassa]